MPAGSVIPQRQWVTDRIHRLLSQVNDLKVSHMIDSTADAQHLTTVCRHTKTRFAGAIGKAGFHTHTILEGR